MVKRNQHIAKLSGLYIFPKVAKRKEAFLKEEPNAELISLGIGDTPGPLTPHATQGLVKAAKAQGTPEGYRGYPPFQGIPELREKIANVLYNDQVDADEIFISDGSKCDIGRLQVLFDSDVKVAVQDPAYPVYVDTSVSTGKTGHIDAEGAQYDDIIYMPCTPENGFFPNLDTLPRPDIIFYCSPNNPTGVCATKEQLKLLIQYAKKNKSIIIYDSAYSSYIRDPEIPKSIFEIEGAREVAIETGSFSKRAGFTGVRLGWTIVPKELLFDDGTPVAQDWSRIMSTFFNGASNISQSGGLAALDPEGIAETQALTQTYLDNATRIRELLNSKGITTYGGKNCPYIWAHFPGEKSWDAFERIMRTSHVITTPGVGFGPSGEGFIRLSAFGKPENVDEAITRLKRLES